LPLLVGGDLPQKEAEQCRRHLQHCDPCRQVHRQIERSQQTLGRLAESPNDDASSPALWPRIGTALHPHDPRRRPTRDIYRHVRLLAAACVALAAVTLGISALFGPQQSTPAPPEAARATLPPVSSARRDVVTTVRPVDGSAEARFLLREAMPAWGDPRGDTMGTASPRRNALNYFRLDEVRLISSDDTDF